MTTTSYTTCHWCGVETDDTFRTPPEGIDTLTSYLVCQPECPERPAGTQVFRRPLYGHIQVLASKHREVA